LGPNRIKIPIEFLVKNMEPQSPSKVLYIHQDGLVTGSFISLTYLIKGLNRLLFTPEVIFLNDGPAIKEMLNMGVTAHLCPSPTFWTNPGPRFLSFGNLDNYKALIPNFKLRRLIKSIQPDIIHLNDKAALNAGISIFGLKIPIVQHVRSTFYGLKAGINKFIQKSVIAIYADSIIGITETETREFKAYNAKTVYNSLDLSEVNEAIKSIHHTKLEIHIDHNTLNIGWVARYSRSKGLWDFMDLVQSIVEQNPNWNIRFYLVGKLPDDNDKEQDPMTKEFYSIKARFNKYLENKELATKLVLLGYRKDYLNIMAALDIVINCNRLGSMGRQAFETMAVGTVSIATHRYPEINEMISHGKDGYVVKEGDIQSIQKIIDKLYNDRKMLALVSESAQKNAQQEFSNLIQTQKIEKEYLRLLSHKRTN